MGSVTSRPPRCYLPDAAAGVVTLDPGEGHHLTRVLRLGTGAGVIAFDGQGREWRARVAAVSREVVRLELLDPQAPIPEPAVAVTLAVSLLKGDQMNAVVRDATVLGAAAIVPLVSAHIARPATSVSTRHAARWLRVAVAAAKQCGRSVVPAIRDTMSLADALADANFGLRIVCVEPARLGRRDALGTPPPRSALVCVGPEGGWAAAELELAEARGATLLSLGPRTLRAEVAPAVALVSLWTRWGWT